MHKIQPNKIIMHNIEVIRNKLSDLEKHKEIIQNPKIEKNINKIKNELEKITYYYNTELSHDEMNLPIRKKITIKNKKPSKSFFRWVFNNNEL